MKKTLTAFSLAIFSMACIGCNESPNKIDLTQSVEERPPKQDLTCEEVLVQVSQDLNAQIAFQFGQLSHFKEKISTCRDNRKDLKERFDKKTERLQTCRDNRKNLQEKVSRLRERIEILRQKLKELQ